MDDASGLDLSSNAADGLTGRWEELGAGLRCFLAPALGEEAPSFCSAPFGLLLSSDCRLLPADGEDGGPFLPFFDLGFLSLCPGWESLSAELLVEVAPSWSSSPSRGCTANNSAAAATSATSGWKASNFSASTWEWGGEMKCEERLV